MLLHSQSTCMLLTVQNDMLEISTLTDLIPPWLYILQNFVLIVYKAIFQL